MVKRPTWTLIFGYICFIGVLLFLALCSSGCGSRRSEVSIQKDVDKSTEKSTNEGNLIKESSTNQESKLSEQLAKVNEKQEQRITELYDSLGRLKQRITENVSSKDTDNSRKQESRSYITKLRVDSNFYTTVYKDREIVKYIKQKETLSSNAALYWVIGVLGAIALLFAYLYWKVRRKVTPSLF